MYNVVLIPRDARNRQDGVMSIPAADLPVPARVRALAGAARLTPLWENELGGVTFRADPPHDGEAPPRVIKFGPHDPEGPMLDEAERLEWAATFTPVPEVFDAGRDSSHEWLVTSLVPGRSAVDPAWIAKPTIAAFAAGAALRRLHDALPVIDCPFDWSVETRIHNARFRGFDIPEFLLTPPEIDVLVVCHGDACVPNTLLNDDGSLAAHVDLGALGVADRWADLAVATLSTQWNYGPGHEDELLAGYGVARDDERIAYYRALWENT